MTRKEQIAERIKTMRMSRGMSQQDLANALHCGQSTIAMYETGKRMPDPETIDYMADVFNIPPYSIMYGEDEIEPKYGNLKDKLNDIGQQLTSASRSDTYKSLNAELSSIDFALLGEIHDMTDEEKQDVLDYVRFKNAQKAKQEERQ